MNVNINRDFCKRVANNPQSSETEKILANYAIRLSERIGKLEHESNQYKQYLVRIYGGIMNQFPWIKEIHEKAVFYTQKDILEKAKAMFPMANPPFDGKMDEN